MCYGMWYDEDKYNGMIMTTGPLRGYGRSEEIMQFTSSVCANVSIFCPDFVQRDQCWSRNVKLRVGVLRDGCLEGERVQIRCKCSASLVVTCNR